jgi:hypothetical protein
MENRELTVKSGDHASSSELIGHSITYRIGVGPHQGQKAFTPQTMPATTRERGDGGLAKAAGFSLRCGVAAGALRRAKLERPCLYVTRPALATEHLSLARQDNIRYRLKTPYRDGTTLVIFAPLDEPKPK